MAKPPPVWKTYETQAELAARLGVPATVLDNFPAVMCDGERRFTPPQVEAIEGAYNALKQPKTKGFDGTPNDVIHELVAMLQEAHKANVNLLKAFTEPQAKLNSFWERAVERERAVADSLWKTHAQALEARETALNESARRAVEIMAQQRKDDRFEQLLKPFIDSGPMLAIALTELVGQAAIRLGARPPSPAEGNGADHGEPIAAEGEVVADGANEVTEEKSDG